MKYNLKNIYLTDFFFYKKKYNYNFYIILLQTVECIHLLMFRYVKISIYLNKVFFI